jgi:probable rRNA maturation factor
MSIEVELQIASDVQTLPHPSQFREWVSASLWGRVDTGEMVIRIVDEEEGTELNEQYRHKKGPTNVLSFPYEPTPGVASRYLGDIIICAPIVQSEADKYNKSILAYWAHMVVHGTLHLIGYDHELEKDAAEMEAAETEILLALGFPPPYGEMIIHD